ncbi:MAG: SDR family NAD(P)-dependent oxidoreductase, partial [Alphaproteobacteria bacterium]|nr:SDR family NAD(P)-dependent oxidoreductase [Alphaproteobacteria bacterium]
MDLKLNDKRALVLGASKGIGRAIADGLAAEGASVVVASRDGAACEQVAKDLSEQYGVRVLGTSCDMGDLDAVDSVAAFATQEMGGVDILVNNTGGPPFGPVSQVDSDTWRQYFDSMFVSVTRLTGHLLPGMRERGWGRVLLVTSTGVVEPIPQLGISNALRIGLTNWAKTLSIEVAPDGVTVNALMPGRIETDRLRQFYQVGADQRAIAPEEVKAEVAAAIPAGRAGRPEEFA